MSKQRETYDGESPLDGLHVDDAAVIAAWTAFFGEGVTTLSGEWCVPVEAVARHRPRIEAALLALPAADKRVERSAQGTIDPLLAAAPTEEERQHE